MYSCVYRDYDYEMVWLVLTVQILSKTIKSNSALKGRVFYGFDLCDDGGADDETVLVED